MAELLTFARLYQLRHANTAAEEQEDESTSGLMMEQFKRYGQFVVMDATCKVNRFGMPLVLLVGVDDTHTTSIFGMGLIKVEDIESYTWLLSTFKQAVGTPHSPPAPHSHLMVNYCFQLSPIHIVA